jgi:GAF domain-containing protein
MVVESRPGPADELAGIFASLSGLLLTQQTVDTALADITSLAVDTLAGSSGSGVSLLDSAGKRITSAATDPLVAQLDALQYQLNDGPCLAAWREQAVMRSGDLANEKRWQTWPSSALELGLRSVLSAPLTTADRSLGAMKVYSTVADAYGENDEKLLRRFADHAAIFVGNLQTAQAAEHVSELLKETLNSRDVIATARGIVMVQQRLDVDGAYRHLMTLAQRARLPLRQLAERIVDDPSAANQTR